MSKAIIVIPTYNESDNIEKLVRQLLEMPLQLSVLIVDDNSPDGTGDIADRLAKEFHEVHVIHRKCKSGLGTAYVEGFKYALQEGFDYIFEMDADFSHDPKYIKDIFEKTDEYDVVIGSRYINGIRIYNWTFQRLVLSLFANRYFQCVTKMPIHDLSSGFKCFKKNALESIDLEQVISKGFCFQIEVPYKIYRKGFKIGEVPILFYNRRLGASKISFKIMWEALFLVIRLRLTV